MPCLSDRAPPTYGLFNAQRSTQLYYEKGITLSSILSWGNKTVALAAGAAAAAATETTLKCHQLHRASLFSMILSLNTHTVISGRAKTS